MRFIDQHSRLAMEAIYAMVMLVLLWWYYSGDTFCTKTGRSLPLAVLCLSLILLTLDLSATLAGVALARLARISGFYGAAIAAALVGMTAELFPYVLNKLGQFDAGTHRYDLTCLVTEGYAMIFPMITVPMIALGTFLRECAVVSLQRRISRRRSPGIDFGI